MCDPEQQDETYDMYDEFDCEVEEGAKTMEVKEEDDLETDFEVLESDDDQSEENGEWAIHFYTFYFTHVTFFVGISDQN